MECYTWSLIEIELISARKKYRLCSDFGISKNPFLLFKLRNSLQVGLPMIHISPVPLFLMSADPCNPILRITSSQVYSFYRLRMAFALSWSKCEIHISYTFLIENYTLPLLWYSQILEHASGTPLDLPLELRVIVYNAEKLMTALNSLAFANIKKLYVSCHFR